ncbi:MAG: TetR/AcrR family transcriptional regulator [Myxococcota bacterium]
MRAASRLLAERGYGRTRIGDIAGAAGVSPATVYKHFRGKTEIFAAVVDAFKTELLHARPRVRDIEPLTDGIRVFLNWYAATLTNVSALGFLRLIISEATQFPEIVEVFYERGKAQVFEPLGKLLHEAEQRDELRLEKVELALRQLLGMVEASLLLRGLLRGEPIEEAHVREVVEEALLTFLARYRA